jgi:uncharacterized protein YjiS (DUF1127 family)
MTRQELIDKLFIWYCEWIEIMTIKEYVHQEQRSMIMKKDKMRRLNCMTDEQLKDLFIRELIRRESYANESQGQDNL